MRDAHKQYVQKRALAGMSDMAGCGIYFMPCFHNFQNEKRIFPAVSHASKGRIASSVNFIYFVFFFISSHPTFNSERKIIVNAKNVRNELNGMDNCDG